MQITDLAEVSLLISEPQSKCPAEGLSRPLKYKDSHTHMRWM